MVKVSTELSTKLFNALFSEIDFKCWKCNERNIATCFILLIIYYVNVLFLYAFGEFSAFKLKWKSYSTNENYISRKN